MGTTIGALRRVRHAVAAGLVVTVVGAGGVAPAAAAEPLALGVTAVVVNQRCLGGDVVVVTLAAVAQSSSQPVMYRWDLNNDGSLDTPSRPSPVALRFAGDERLVSSRVVATNPEGNTAEDTVTYATQRCQ